jgi:hypothetical protein
LISHKFAADEKVQDLAQEVSAAIHNPRTTKQLKRRRAELDLMGA